LLLLAAVVGVSAAGAALAQRLLRERRELLIRGLESQLETSASSVVGLVSERARDVRSDLVTALSVVYQGKASISRGLEAVHTHLVALGRTTKHYRRLWYLRGGEVLTEVSGSRRTERPAPRIRAESVAAVASRASQRPGQIATVAPRTAGPSDGERTRLFALARKSIPDDVIAVLVSMDVLFDTLQRRARLPGTDLWVIDARGQVLVDPGQVPAGHRPRVIALLTSRERSGSQVLGAWPTAWPFGRDGSDSALLAWKSAEGPAIRWSVGLAGSMGYVAAELQGMAARLLVVGVIGLAIVSAILWWFAHLQSRQRRLKERVAYRDRLVQAERLSTLGQLSASLAHEIGTPLGVISIRLDQMLENPELEAEHGKVRIMKEQIDRMSRMMQRFLQHARTRPTESRPVSLRDVVARVHDLMEHRLQKRAVSLRASVPGSAFVQADSDELHQVFLNLLVNACDACQAGDSIRITVAHDAPPGTVRIHVSDTGPGISEDVKDSVFEPFVSAKDNAEGTGLGLTIVRDIVRRHGAAIEVASSSQGTCFTLDWPAARTAEVVSSSVSEVQS